MSEKKINKNKKFDKNPRIITKRDFELLKDHLKHLGDLSGVIYCRNNEAYVGGNQRSEIFHGAEIEVVEEYKEPTASKTLMHGFIKHNGEKFAYREVAFTEDEFRKACIVANNSGGENDWEMLANEFDQEELTEWGLDFPHEKPKKGGDNGEGGGGPMGIFPLNIVLDAFQYKNFQEFKKANKLKTDTEAFFHLYNAAEKSKEE